MEDLDGTKPYDEYLTCYVAGGDEKYRLTVAGYSGTEGNDNIHSLLSSGQFTLRVDVEALDGTKTYAEYSTFKLGGEDEKYKLTIKGYSGTAGDAMQYHDKLQFSTKDSDNDIFSRNCALNHKSRWWFHKSFDSNLNLLYWRGFGNKNASMKVKEKEN